MPRGACRDADGGDGSPVRLALNDPLVDECKARCLLDESCAGVEVGRDICELHLSASMFDHTQPIDRVTCHQKVLGGFQVLDYELMPTGVCQPGYAVVGDVLGCTIARLQLQLSDSELRVQDDDRKPIGCYLFTSLQGREQVFFNAHAGSVDADRRQTSVRRSICARERH